MIEPRVLNAEGFLDRRAALPPPDGVSEGVTVGAYTLVSPIGHGGMGSVWLASRSDGRFEGQAALKLLNSALVGRAGEERFRRVGTILARLTTRTSRASSTPASRRPDNRIWCSN